MNNMTNHYNNRPEAQATPARASIIRLFILAILTLFTTGGVAQVTGDKYNSRYNNFDVSGTNIIHK